MDEGYREVDFKNYCRECKYWETQDTDEPCNECLEQPMVLHSRKPVNYKPKTEKG